MSAPATCARCGEPIVQHRSGRWFHEDNNTDHGHPAAPAVAPPTRTYGIVRGLR